MTNWTHIPPLPYVVQALSSLCPCSFSIGDMQNAEIRCSTHVRHNQDGRPCALPFFSIFLSFAHNPQLWQPWGYVAVHLNKLNSSGRGARKRDYEICGTHPLLCSELHFICQLAHCTQWHWDWYYSCGICMEVIKTTNCTARSPLNVSYLQGHWFR